MRDEAEFVLPDVNALLVNNNIVLNAANYNNYAPTKTGVGSSGTWPINIAGNAASATSAASATNAITATNAINAITQASSDNSTRIANTAFVKTQISTVARDVAYFQVSDNTFNWGDNVFSGYFLYRISTGTRWYSPESYFIRLDNPSFLWYWISDPGRRNSIQIVNKFIETQYLPSDTFLSFRVSISTYPLPNQLRIRIYSLIDPTPITLFNHSRALSP